MIIQLSQIRFQYYHTKNKSVALFIIFSGIKNQTHCRRLSYSCRLHHNNRRQLNRFRFLSTERRKSFLQRSRESQFSQYMPSKTRHLDQTQAKNLQSNASRGAIFGPNECELFASLVTRGASHQERFSHISCDARKTIQRQNFAMDWTTDARFLGLDQRFIAGASSEIHPHSNRRI